MYLDVSWCLQFITVQSPQSALERLGAAWDLPSDSPLTTAPASGDKPLLCIDKTVHQPPNIVFTYIHMHLSCIHTVIHTYSLF